MLGVLSGFHSGVEGEFLVQDGASLTILVVHHQCLVEGWVVDVLVWEWGYLGVLVRWNGLWLWLGEDGLE